MVTINDWQDQYSLGRQNLLKGDRASAYRFGYTCWEILRDSFNMADNEGQLYMLKLLHKTAHLVFDSFEDDDCPKCAKNHLETAQRNYEAILLCENYSAEVRNGARFFAKKLEKEISQRVLH